MKQKTSFYFVLYLVALVSLLDVITERDDAQREIISILISKITEAPVLAVRDTVLWFPKDSSRALIGITGLDTEAEKKSVRYELKPLDGTRPEGISDGILTDADGNGLLLGRIGDKGTYKFQVFATVDRDLPSDLPEAVRDVIKRQLGDQIPLKTKPIDFVIRVEGTTAELPALTLNIEPPRDDKWIVGVPYTKAIYVGGPSPDIVSFNSSDTRFTISKDIGKINLRWDNPTVTEDPIRLTVTARANRNAAPHLDYATLTFSVSVAPPRWDPEPNEQAFWGVPYTFQSGVRGLDPAKYTVEILANGSMLVRTLSAIEYPFILTPDPSWTSLSFRALSTSQSTLLDKEIPVKKPLPPQIRWTGSTWQGNEYMVKFTSSDVTGDDIVVDYCAVIQPEGLVSRIDTRRGKIFTLTVQNLKNTRPSAIRIKVTVTGVGGSRTDQVTQPIMY